MCEQKDENIIIAFAINGNMPLLDMNRWNGSCGVGNTARLILKLQEIDEETYASNMSAALERYKIQIQGTND